MRFIGWLALGLVVYVLYGYRNSRLRRRDAGPRPPDFNPESQLPQ
jgi:APA family basic amino acid/polyamine antiporter